MTFVAVLERSGARSFACDRRNASARSGSSGENRPVSEVSAALEAIPFLSKPPAQAARAAAGDRYRPHRRRERARRASPEPGGAWRDGHAPPRRDPPRDPASVSDCLPARAPPEVSGKLSPAAYETLAIVAYQQPVARARIEEVRGVNCESVADQPRTARPDRRGRARNWSRPAQAVRHDDAISPGHGSRVAGIACPRRESSARLMRAHHRADERQTKNA